MEPDDKLSTGVDIHDALIDRMAETIKNLIHANWTQIIQTPDEEKEEPARVGITAIIDSTSKSPSAGVTLSFSKKYKDEATVRVEYPEQEQMEY